MNRNLIIRMLGALLLIEGAAMLPALVVSLVYRESDALLIMYSILLVLLAGAGMFFLPKKDREAGRARC